MKNNENINKRNDLVSIVLPTYNGAKRLERAIISCLNQTYTNIEIIIVDDCSTDATPEIINSINDKRIVYVRNDRNKKLPITLNNGFSRSNGYYLSWISDDNEYLPTAIEEMVNFLKYNEDVDLVYADYMVHNEMEDTIIPKFMEDNLNLVTGNGVGACFMYTRKVLKNIGGYNPKYYLVEDYDYWIRVCSKYKSVHLNAVLYNYYKHNNSLTNTKKLLIQFYDSILKYENNYITIDSFKKCIVDFVLRTIRLRKNLRSTLIHLKVIKPMVSEKSFLDKTIFLFTILWLLLNRIINKMISNNQNKSTILSFIQF